MVSLVLACWGLAQAWVLCHWQVQWVLQLYLPVQTMTTAVVAAVVEIPAPCLQKMRVAWQKPSVT